MSRNETKPWEDYTNETKPWEDYTSNDKDKNSPKVGQIQTLIDSALQAASFGFVDEAEALLKTAFSDNSRNKSIGEVYKEKKGEIGERIALGEQQNPGTALTGTVLGSFLSPVPGSSLKAASTLGKAGYGVVRGSAAGGLAAIGEAEDLNNVPVDILRGGTVGGVVGGVVEPIGHLIGKLRRAYSKEGARSVATKEGEKAAKTIYDDSNLPDSFIQEFRLAADDSSKKMSSADIGNWMREYNIDPFMTHEARYKKLNETISDLTNIKNTQLRSIDEYLIKEKADDFFPTLNETKGKLNILKQQIKETDLLDSDKFKKGWDSIIEGLDNISYKPFSKAKEKFVTFTDLQEVIRNLDDNISNWASTNVKQRLKKDARRELRGLLLDKLNEFNPTSSELIKHLNENISIGLKMQEGFKNAATRETAPKATKRFMDTSETFTAGQLMKGTSGMAYMGAIKGVQTLRDKWNKFKFKKSTAMEKHFNKIADKYPSMTKTEKLMFDEAAKRGGIPAVISTMFLLKQQDEKYRKDFQDNE